MKGRKEKGEDTSRGKETEGSEKEHEGKERKIEIKNQSKGMRKKKKKRTKEEEEGEEEGQPEAEDEGESSKLRLCMGGVRQGVRNQCALQKHEGSTNPGRNMSTTRTCRF